MQSGVNALCHLGCVERAVKEAVNVAALVCPCKEIVELPHIKIAPKTAKVIVVDICLGHGIDLRVCKQHPWQCLLITCWQALV